jgi:hypothetical protein
LASSVNQNWRDYTQVLTQDLTEQSQCTEKTLIPGK